MKSLTMILLIVFILCSNVFAQKLDNEDFLIIKAFESQLSSGILRDFYAKDSVNLWDITSTYYEYKSKVIECFMYEVKDEEGEAIKVSIGERSIDGFLGYYERRFLESYEGRVNIDHFIAEPMRIKAFKRKIRDDYALSGYLDELILKKQELTLELIKLTEEIKAIDVLRDPNKFREKETK